MSTPSSPQSSPGSSVPQESRSATPAPLDTAPAPAAALPPGFVAEAELAKARTDRAAAEERSKVMEEQLKTIASELQDLRAQNEEAIGLREQLEEKLKEAEQVATTVKDDLQEIRQARSKDAMTMAAQDLEMQKLSEKLTEQTEILERERTLLAAGRDIHDLMEARNLHIADVFDVDSKGKDQRAFGRVFYTEQKSLIFYAFDLGDRNTAKRNASFQVWGTRGPVQNPVQSLGIFYVDDQKQNRWLLKFEDPRILAEIDSVFVTIEPPGGSARPTGRKFLYAYLNANPNHP
jgi:membrane carboxypeptidase/penicillin-binding protein